MLMTNVESPSTMALFIPSQCRISRMISKAPNFTALFVEFPRLPVYSWMIFPWMSLITPPIHVHLGLPFDALLKFILRDPSGGGFHLCSLTCSCGGRLTWLGLRPHFSWKAFIIQRSWCVSCALPVWSLRLYIVSLVTEIIVSLIFPTIQLWFLKMHWFLSFHISHMIIPRMRVQQRFTSSFSLYFSFHMLIVADISPLILLDIWKMPTS